MGKEEYKYICGLLSDSTKRTYASVRNHTQALLLTILLPIALALLLILFPRLNEVIGKQPIMIETIIAIAGLVAVALLIMGTFFWNMLHAPYRRNQILVTDLATVQTEIRDLREQLEPKLAISIEHEPVSSGGILTIGTRSYFWRLKVVNISRAPIDRCYGEITHCYLIGENGRRIVDPIESWPKEGHGLPWARESSSSDGWYERSFGGGEPAYLDYIMLPNQQAGFPYVPSRPNSPNERPNYTSYAMPGDEFEFGIAVGSRAQAIERTTIHFVFEWKSGSKATITELKNTSPQVLDKEGSQT